MTEAITKNVRITIIGRGLNFIETRELDVTKSQEITLRAKKYKVKPDAFFLRRRNPISRLFHRTDEYDILFIEGNKDPLRVEAAKEGLTSGMLKVVKESDAVQKALRELFQKPFGMGGKQLIFISIVIITAAVGFLVWSGQLDLGSLI